MVVDFHTHVFSPRLKANRARYVEKDPCFAMLYTSEKAKLATADELIASMDQDGVDISVILNLGWTTHDLCVETNDYILESVAKYPRRLIGFCAIQPRSPDDAVAEIERCVRAGARGIGELRPDVQGFDPSDKALLAPVVEALKRHNLILLTHSSEPVGHTYPGKGAVTPEKLYPLTTSFPDLTIICAHWGGGLPFYALMPEVKRALKNVFFDTAASPFLYRPQVYGEVASLVGADKVLFGSDYPLLQPSRLLKEIEDCTLTEEARQLILSGNARKLLGLKEG